MRNRPSFEIVDLAEQSRLPDHVAIIMDGNGRWAIKRGISRLEGHRQGVKNVRNIVELCGNLKISYLTLFAFSSENWKRPGSEVQWLMRLLSLALDSEVQKLHDEGICLKFIGDLSDLSGAIQKKIAAAERLTNSNGNMQLTIAVNYGGHWDLTQACQKIARQAMDGELAIEDITPATIDKHLSTAPIPNPDFFIRTGGERRVSNFILWQLAYTELYFTDTCWPDFDKRAFLEALKSFSARVRRFGGIAHEPVKVENQHA